MRGGTLCVQIDAERRTLRFHAERGNDQRGLGAERVSIISGAVRLVAAKVVSPL
jgi:hypothetical protein